MGPLSRSGVANFIASLVERFSTREGRPPCRPGSGRGQGTNAVFWPTLALFILLAPRGSGSIVLRPGCDHSIILATNANVVTRFAAQELQHYVRAITGADLPVRTEDQTNGLPRRFILVGESGLTRALGVELDDPTPEAFRIRTLDGQLILLGDDRPSDKAGNSLIPFSYFYARKGTVFAVYELLERCGGVRWLFPGPDGEVVPPAAALTVPPLDIRERPDLPNRWFWSAAGVNDRFDVLDAVQDHRALWLMRIRQGMTLNLGFRNGFAHSWGELIGGNAHFDTHPEYYPELGGSRQQVYVNAEGRPDNSQNQVCTSNPDVVRLFAERLRGMYQPEDEVIVSIAPNDGGGFCECADCRALDHPERYGPDEGYQGKVLSDRIYIFVNQVARELKTTHPKLKVGIMAYTFYNDPPRTVPLLESNVMLKFVEQPESFPTQPAYRDRMRRNLTAWAQRVSGGIEISEHYDDQNRIPVSQFLPTIAEHSRSLAARRAVNGICMETHAYLPLRHLDYYVLSRLMWNSRLNVEELVNDYCRSGFGPAAADMRRLIDDLNATFARRMAGAGTTANAGGVPRLWLPEDIQRAFDLLDRAAAAAGNDPAIGKRLNFWRQGLEFLRQFREVAAQCAELDDNGLMIDLIGKETYPAHEYRGRLSAAERDALAIRAHEACERLETFLREGCATPGLDPRQMWNNVLTRGDFRALAPHAAIARGAVHAVIDTDFAGGQAPGWQVENERLAFQPDDTAASGFSAEASVTGSNQVTVMKRLIRPLKPGRTYVVGLRFRRLSADDATPAETAPEWIDSPTLIIRRHSPTHGYLLARHGPDCRPQWMKIRVPARRSDWIEVRRTLPTPVNVDFSGLQLTLQIPPGRWRIGSLTLDEVNAPP